MLKSNNDNINNGYTCSEPLLCGKNFMYIISFIPHTNLRSRYYSYPHCIDKEIGPEKFATFKVTQVASHGGGIKTLSPASLLLVY